MIDRRALFSLALGASLASWSGPARAEVSEVHLVRQFGIGYLPLTIMLHEKLVEKHAAKAGLPSLTTKWSVLGNAVPINDGLIAGTIHVGSGGIAPMVTAWDRTRGNVGIQGIGALCALPIFLVSRHPYKSVKEFTDKDRISMAGAGQSIQTHVPADGGRQGVRHRRVQEAQSAVRQPVPSRRARGPAFRPARSRPRSSRRRSSTAPSRRACTRC